MYICLKWREEILLHGPARARISCLQGSWEAFKNSEDTCREKLDKGCDACLAAVLLHLQKDAVQAQVVGVT